MDRPRTPILIALTLAAALGLLASACAGGPPSASPRPSPPATSPEPSPSDSPWPTPTMPRPTRTPDTPEPWPSTPTPTPPAIPASLLGTQWYRLPTSAKVVALTFDAGANADGVPSILETLEEKGVPATFFLTGRWVESYPGYAARIGAGYPVGNHTYDHPDLTTLSDRAVRDEIGMAEDDIQAATGQDPRPMFRFPFGASDHRTIGIVNSEGYGAINWTVDTRGWQGTSGGQSVESVIDRVMADLQSGAIVIMHVGSNPDDGSTLDADALPQLIDQILAAGYTFVTVDQYL